MDDATREGREVAARVFGTFLRGSSAKPKRARPHRCLGCGKKEGT